MNGVLALGTEEMEIMAVSFFNAVCVTLPLYGLPDLPGWEQECCHSMSSDARSLGHFPGRLLSQQSAA